ncbi:hypothetical protein GCM10010502_72950 [Kitasatospora aureofaciens]|uniref:Uncharacterized protein n=1 Tax=Kitasatospora aureofaciens TaxID=1894 RepID=A0A8H9I295_KITAU|nr:hypothetical protein GCM10010502_72950 [Kitasatospora aureofaciens]
MGAALALLPAAAGRPGRHDGLRGAPDAVADLRLAAEKSPTVAEMLAAVPAGAARIEDLIQRGPAAPIWHPLSSSGRACGWTEL